MSRLIKVAKSGSNQHIRNRGLCCACSHGGDGQDTKARRYRVRLPATRFGECAFPASIEETAPYKIGKLLTTSFELATKDGLAVTGADIEIDGGMPQHGHGFPTKPRVTRELEPERYEISGLKFNMGGWW